MRGNNLPQLTGTKRSLLFLLASSVLFAAGCSNMLSTALSSSPVAAAKSIGGKVHGGSQPVAGATVKLYYAGQTPTPISEAATTTTDPTGAFAFTNSGTTGQPENGSIYSCPASNPLVYVVARGGNTLGDGNVTESNSAAAFIGVYGLCSQLTSSNFLELNEVTTVATMLAVQQYYDPAVEGLIADGTGAAKTAIDETPATISNLANTTTGAALTSKIIPGVNALSGITVTATPESSKINLMANILTSCVNNASASASNCTTLFANAVPPASAHSTNHPSETFTEATDVLQALDYMLTNPTSGGPANLANLFALAGGTAAAFQPALAVQPSDWTVAISYSSSGNCANGGALISAPSAVAIDSSGDVWIGNGQTTKGNVVELSSSAVPKLCNSFGSGATPAPSAVFIDSAGSAGGDSNIWSALSGSSTLTRYNPNTGASLSFTAVRPILTIAGDGTGDIYFTVAGAIYEIPGGFANGATAITPVLLSSAVTDATSLMPDANGVDWASSGTSALQQLSGTSVTPYTATANTKSVAVTGSSNVYVSAVTPGNSISYFINGGASGYLLQNGWPATAPLAGINQPAAIAVDGASNIWSANAAANTNPAFASDPTASPTLYGVSEISLDAVPLSPDTASGAFQKPASFLNGSSNSGIIVDQSGNVWVVGGASANNFITEIVGAGVPIYQPYAFGLYKGRFQSAP
jgi:hypothetical protein